MDNFPTPLIDISYSVNGLQPEESKNKESEVSVSSTNGDMDLEKPNKISTNKDESTPSSSLKYDT